MARQREELELNMTPMIDVVFNLLVFFMIVSDLTHKEFDDLSLPWSTAAIVIDGEDRTVVNISKAEGWDASGAVRIRVSGDEFDLAGLRERLFVAAERRRAEGAETSEATVHIRCDQDIRWREVQWVLQACAGPPVRIHRIEFATSKEP